MHYRNKVYDKYNGRCAYCGCEITLDNFQVDHKLPKAAGGTDNFDNLMPACKECNHYKRALDIHTFRKEWLGKLHTRIKRIPKNPTSEKGKRYKAYMEKILTKYGISEDKPFDGKFYFEKLEQVNNKKAKATKQIKVELKSNLFNKPTCFNIKVWQLKYPIDLLNNLLEMLKVACSGKPYIKECKVYVPGEKGCCYGYKISYRGGLYSAILISGERTKGWAEVDAIQAINKIKFNSDLLNYGITFLNEGYENIDKKIRGTKDADKTR